MSEAVLPEPSEGGTPETGRIEGWRGAEDRFRAAMALAAAQALDVWLADAHFAHWPLGERAVMETWHQWALAGGRRHATLLAARYDDLPGRHPRWVAWRTTWAHRVACREAHEGLKDEVPTLVIVGDVLAVKVLDPLRGTGLWTRDPVRIGEWRAELDVILQRSSEALPPTTLGL
ncbi:hypothetical protein [uncultured Aquabacterium sp.]|uniref:hypothetical protein n=1 Tax=Aquabacterium sp. TaxID=1872578 RepID=UPI0025F000DC|nr:hypothetical protein [uncultured Aquabacterium sp.]